MTDDSADDKQFIPRCRGFYECATLIYKIMYLSSAGIESERTIRILDIYSARSDIYLEAICGDSSEPITFKVKNIQRLFAIPSGREIDFPHNYFSLFCDPIVVKPPVQQTMAVARSGLTCIIWALRAEKIVDLAAGDVTYEYALERRSLFRKPDSPDVDKDEVFQWCSRFEPVFDDVKRQIERGVEIGKDRDLLVKYLDRISQFSKAIERRVERIKSIF